MAPDAEHALRWLTIADSLRKALAATGPFESPLPDGGRIHFDRRLPFLIAYRKTSHAAREPGAQLISSEAAHLLVAPHAAGTKLPRLADLIADTCAYLRETLGGFLLVEVWLEDPAGSDAVFDPAAAVAPPRPRFAVWWNRRRPLIPPATAMRKALESIRLFRQLAAVEEGPIDRIAPPGHKPLISTNELIRLGGHSLGLQVAPVFLDAATGAAYPRALRTIKRGVSRAVKQGCYQFMLSHTRVRPSHYYSLGRRKIAPVVWHVDERLASVTSKFDLLLQATPINVDPAWRAFRQSRYEKPPEFHYRPATFDTALLKRELYTAPIDRVDDPTLATLLRQKQDDLDRRITMLADVGLSRFVQGSLQVFGRANPALVATAREILNRVPARAREGRGAVLSAAAFAERVRQEIEGYHRQDPRFTAQVDIRDDLYSGLLCSQGRLLIGKGAAIPESRAEALIHHEVGTHLVTYYNALAQPLKLLKFGLPGYDDLQEGFAVVSEYLCGGLTRGRLRLLAARVMAVDAMLSGATFIETFRSLTGEFGLSRRVAYTVTMRVHRGGGLSKDVVYLRGLVEILDYLRSGRMEPLLVGKIATEHIPMIDELTHRNVLTRPAITPRFLTTPQYERRLARLRAGLSPLDLITEKNP